jgi:hypothetical protein
MSTATTEQSSKFRTNQPNPDRVANQLRRATLYFVEVSPVEGTRPVFGSRYAL